jgi:hypothetical protein
MLIANPAGHYHFLKGIDPYSCGVVADPGHEILFVTFRDAPPWRRGFELIDTHLKSISRDRSALCSIQLRCPEPYPIDGFVAFNDQYREVLADWDLFFEGLNPVSRTNVAPAYAPPAETVMHAFGYTVSASTPNPPPSFVIAGAGELRDGVLVAEGIVRRGETTPAAMRAKADYVMKVMETRLDGLGARWDVLNQINVYTVHPLENFIEDIVLNRLGPARRMGIHWHHTRPPVQEIEYEMDMRGVHRELVL